MDIVARMQQLMRAKGIKTPNELSTLSHIPQSTLSAIFRESNRPSIATIDLVAQYFGMTLAEFFADPDTDTLYPLTDQQRELIRRWNNLTDEKRAVVLELLDVMK